MEPPFKPVGEAPIRDLTRHLMAMQSRLYSYLSGSLPTEVDIESILQDLNLAVLKGDRATEISNYDAYIWAAARNKLRDAIRSRKRERITPVEAGVLEKLSDHWVAINRGWSDKDGDPRQQALRHCLASMTPAESDLLRRRYAADETVRSMAEKAGKSEWAMQKVFHRLRLRLKECIERRISVDERFTMIEGEG